MPAGRRRSVVGVCRAGVQDVRVGEELDIANVKNHVQGEAVAGGLEDLESLDLGGGEGWDDALVREAGQRADVVGVPSAVQLDIVRDKQLGDGATHLVYTRPFSPRSR